MTIFAVFLWCLTRFYLFEAPKRSVKTKKYVILSPYLYWDNKGEDCVFVKLPTYAISVSLTIELHKNNTDTSSVTNKQYHKIILF